MPTFGERFKALRQENQMNQEDMINDFNKRHNYGFTKASVSQYENEKRMPEINALTAFADYFHVSIDYILGKTDIKSTEDLQILIEYLRVLKEARRKGISPEDINMAIDFLLRARKRDK